MLPLRLVGVDRDLSTPRDLHGAEHATSTACRRCHPSQFKSWRRTFHRTMTQRASEESVLGDFDEARFAYGGVEARMSRTAERGFQMEFYGPEGLLSRARVIATVGSHRYQQYLAREGDIVFRLPMAWHVEEERWFHMNGAFLTPDPPPPPTGSRIALADYMRHVTRWNDNCIFCHNVSADPGWDPDQERWDSRVAELGIACEACHGPAERHARANADPLRRYALHLADRPDPTIVNPARLPAERSAEVCGRCHGQRITDDVGPFLREGDPYVPGDRLADYSRPLTRDTELSGDGTAFAARFWSDGTPRLTAYEYQGLLQSPCDGLTCTTCHGMHEGNPAGQIRPSARGDAACTRCHEHLAERPRSAAHARHTRPVSCVDCHMPRIVYGLIDTRRSHRIEIPDPSIQVDRPDACTLCHADRTRSWAVRAYRDRWGGGGGPSPTRTPEPRLYRDALSGDPIERAVALRALGNPAGLRSEQYRARRVGLLLDTLVEDPYPALRHIAYRSLRRIAAGAALPRAAYLPTGTVAARAAWVEDAWQTLGERATPIDRGRAAELRARAAKVAIEIGE